MQREYPEGIRVIARQTQSAIEVDIESYGIFFGPHMKGIGSGLWVLELGKQETKYTAVRINGESDLRFSNIASMDDANELIRFIDTIITINQQRVRMIDAFTTQFTGLEFDSDHANSSFTMCGRRGSVSIHNISDLLIVYLQSYEEPLLFEPFMKREFGPINETDGPSYVLSYEGQIFPGATYVEDEIYDFCFRYPHDEAQIRILVSAVAEILRA